MPVTSCFLSICLVMFVISVCRHNFLPLWNWYFNRKKQKTREIDIKLLDSLKTVYSLFFYIENVPLPRTRHYAFTRDLDGKNDDKNRGPGIVMWVTHCWLQGILTRFRTDVLEFFFQSTPRMVPHSPLYLRHCPRLYEREVKRIKRNLLVLQRLSSAGGNI